MAYTLTLEQFKEFIKPFTDKMSERIMKTKHEKLEFDISIPHSGSNYYDTYEIRYYLVGYCTGGRIILDIAKGFELHIMQGESGLVDVDKFQQDDMQEALWRYCYNLYGEDYKIDLIIYMLSERGTKIRELQNYIKGVENADVIDKSVAENEIKAAQEEIAYLQQYYDNALEVIETLGGTVTCN